MKNSNSKSRFVNQNVKGATIAIIFIILVQLAQAKYLGLKIGQNHKKSNNNDNILLRNLKSSTKSSSKCSCTNNNFKDPSARGGRIINGNVAQVGDFPWQVLIQKRNSETLKWEIHCGGVLISEKFVLTAEHCMGLDTDSYRLLVGIVNTKEADKPSVQYKIENHMSYRQRPSVQYEHDIALLKIQKVNEPSQGVTCNENVQPICLEGGPIFISKKQCFISGWGATEEKETSAQLLYASVPLQSRGACKALFNDRKEISFDRFTQFMLCAGISNSKSNEAPIAGQNNSPRVPDTCQGDSGGPLACIDERTNLAYLTGIVSFGTGRCGSGPSVYVHVAHYLQWLLDEMKARP